MRAKINAEIATVRRNPRDADHYKVIISGLPCLLNMDMYVVASNELTVIRLPRVESQIMSTCPWILKTRDASGKLGLRSRNKHHCYSCQA